jgi:hypothetical protein
MKTTKHTRFLLPFVLLLAGIVITSCNQVNNAIQNLLTFNIADSVSFPIVQLTPTGILFPLPGVPIPLDSATLAKNHTAFSLIKTLKLTALTFTPDDPTYPMTNFDTLNLAVGPDSLHTILLATYSGSANKTTLTDNDFAADVTKNSGSKFFVTFELKNDPTHTVNIKTNYTLTFSADPL